jgi:hypothetical protein
MSQCRCAAVTDKRKRSATPNVDSIEGVNYLSATSAFHPSRTFTLRLICENAIPCRHITGAWATLFAVVFAFVLLDNPQRWKSARPSDWGRSRGADSARYCTVKLTSIWFIGDRRWLRTSRIGPQLSDHNQPEGGSSRDYGPLCLAITRSGNGGAFALTVPSRWLPWSDQRERELLRAIKKLSHRIAIVGLERRAHVGCKAEARPVRRPSRWP